MDKDSLVRKSFHFDPVEVKSKIKKTHKDPLKNVWGLPLAKFSKDELVLYMCNFNQKVDKLQRMHNLPLGFAEAVCSALYNYWNSQKLVLMALVNVVSVTQIATNKVKQALVDSKIILAAVVTACRQREYLKYTNDVDDTLENVFSIFYYGLEKDLGSPAKFDTGMIEAIMTIVPYANHHLKRRNSIEEFFWVIRHLLITMDQSYDSESVKRVNHWLSKNEIASFTFEFIKKHPLNNVTDTNFLRMIDVAYFLRGEVNVSSILPTIPNLIALLTLEGKHPLSGDEAEGYIKNVQVVTLIFQHVIENITLDGAEFMIKKVEFLNLMVDALVNNRYYGEVVEDLANIVHKAIAVIIPLIMDSSQVHKQSKVLCAIVLKTLSKQLESLIVAPSCELTTHFSYIFYLCATLSHSWFATVLSIPEDDTLLVMIKSLAVMHDVDHISEMKGKGSVVEAAFSGKRDAAIKHFVTLVDSIAYCCDISQVEETGIRLKLFNVVRDNLPEVVANFVGVKSSISSSFAEAITRLVLLFFDSLEDFFSPRWNGVHHQMLSHYLDVSLSNMQYGQLNDTKLLFMWKLSKMDISKALVFSTLQLEVELRECTDHTACFDEIVERYKNRLMSKTNDFSSEESSEKFFSFVIHDFKRVLKDTAILDTGICGLSNMKLSWITFAMADMAKYYKESSKVKLLKDLVFCGIDFVADSHDSRVTNNFNDFIVHLYIE